jgi:hypothetical protein
MDPVRSRANGVEQGQKIVARFTDTRVVKGFTADFHPEKLRFHVRAPTRGPAEARAVDVRDLKAVFFVRDFGGDPRYQERKRFDDSERPLGRKVEVTFQDGEVLVGSTMTGYAPDRPGFLFTPADPRSNNVRVFAVADAVRSIRYL